MKKRKEIPKLLAFIIGVIGMAAMVILTATVVQRILGAGWYLFWMAVIAVVLQAASIWIEKHFKNGEWV